MTSTPMTTPPQPPYPPGGDPIEPPPPAVPPRLPTGAVLTAGLLLLIPLVALAIVPVYSRATPRLWGFPFFYWYQFAWVVLTSLLLGLIYRALKD
jgi:hypothetical protein